MFYDELFLNLNELSKSWWQIRILHWKWIWFFSILFIKLHQVLKINVRQMNQTNVRQMKLFVEVHFCWEFSYKLLSHNFVQFEIRLQKKDKRNIEFLLKKFSNNRTLFFIRFLICYNIIKHGKAFFLFFIL